MADILVAKEPFAFTGKDGIPRIFTPGQEIYADDPDVKGREHLFEAAGARLSRATSSASETATAAPGERRARSTTRTEQKGDA